ncbi:LysR family transcriptional regulator [Duganella callida]|nr:LysR family transcriptional regulator [Duganella callida]
MAGLHSALGVKKMKAAELRTYQNFLLLAQELHFGRAADLAAITQPALSQQIARLEDSLGVKLFDRDPRQLALTPAGRVFRDGIAKIISNLEQLNQQTMAVAGGEDVSLSIGITEYANLPLIPTALIRLQQFYPASRLMRQEVRCLHHGTALMRAQIDVGVGVVLGPPPPEMPHGADVSSKWLAQSPWRLLVPATHRWAGERALPLSSLAEERIIIFARDVNPPVYDGIMDSCRLAGVTPNIVFETAQGLFGIQLARNGLGLMLGTAFVLGEPPPGMATVLVEGLPPLAIVASWRSDECRPIVRRFLELLCSEGDAYRE